MYIALQTHSNREYDSVRIYSLKTEVAAAKFGAENVFALTSENHRLIAKQLAARTTPGRRLMLPYGAEDEVDVRRLKACLIGYGFRVEAWASPFTKKATRTGRSGTGHVGKPEAKTSASPKTVVITDPAEVERTIASNRQTSKVNKATKAIATEPKPKAKKAKKAKAATYQQGTGNLARDIAAALAPSLKRDVDAELLAIMKASYGIRD